MKGFWRKVLITMGFVPLLFLLNEYYLKPRYSKEAPKPLNVREKQVVIQVDDLSGPTGELKSLVKKVSKKSTEVVLLERIQNFSKNANELLPSLKKDWQEEGIALLKQLEECQGKDYCGMKPDEDGYFDESETHARKHQLRLLEIFNAAYSEDKDSKFLLDTDVLDDFLLSGNEKLITESLKQLQAKGELKSSLQKLEGKGKANALILLSKEVSKEELIQFVEGALNGTSGYDAVSVFEILEKLQFDEEGFTAILKRVCHLKDGMIQNWKPIVAISKKIAKARKFSTDATKICL